MAFQNFINKIEKIVSISSKFKIGETGQTLLSRFNIQYRQEYEKIDLSPKARTRNIKYSTLFLSVYQKCDSFQVIL